MRNTPPPNGPDPRIDKLSAAGILTDTQVRLAFAPADPKAPVVALKASSRAARLVNMQSQMKLGRIYIQIKEGFGAERSIDLSGPEFLMIQELGDRLITELPAAQAATEK